MGAMDMLLKGALLRCRLDPAVKNIIQNKKPRHLSIIIQSTEGIDGRIKKCIAKHGGRLVEEYSLIKACNAVIPPAGIKPLEALYQVRYLSLNSPVWAHLKNMSVIMGSNIAHNLSYTGKNINIALLDTGTYPHPDLIRPVNRILYFKDFINGCEFAYDDNGHGTFTAGIISGNGCMSKDEYMGVAPGSRLISLKVLNQSGNGWVSDVLSGLQWVFDNREKYNIRLVCLPLGSVNFLSFREDPLSVAAQILWDSGVVVCTSAGNNGPEYSWVSSPGINPNIITVGALQSCGGAISAAEPLSVFSSRGLSKDGNRGPDFVAPGTGIISLNADLAFNPKSSLAYRNIRLDSYYRQGYGTSAACAAVTGTIALLLEKNPQLTPDEIKSLLRHSCKSLKLLKGQQGSGLPDINKLLE